MKKKMVQELLTSSSGQQFKAKVWPAALVKMKVWRRARQEKYEQMGLRLSFTPAN